MFSDKLSVKSMGNHLSIGNSWENHYIMIRRSRPGHELGVLQGRHGSNYWQHTLGKANVTTSWKWWCLMSRRKHRVKNPGQILEVVENWVTLRLLQIFQYPNHGLSIIMEEVIVVYNYKFSVEKLPIHSNRQHKSRGKYVSLLVICFITKIYQFYNDM